MAKDEKAVDSKKRMATLLTKGVAVPEPPAKGEPAGPYVEKMRSSLREIGRRALRAQSPKHFRVFRERIEEIKGAIRAAEQA